ncbi:MAG: nuclease-like protein [Gammaproteobacteria bacterium]
MLRRPRVLPFALCAVCVAGALLVTPAGASAAGFSGLASVAADGTLRIRQRTVRLWGVYLPPSAQDCLANLRPPRCGHRIPLLLEQHIAGFVRCTERGRADDGVLLATCHANYSAFDAGDDLAAWLLQQGWALARPEAPFEYHALERIARRTGLGLWGSPLAVQP